MIMMMKRALAFLMVIVFAVFFAPLPHDPLRTHPQNQNQAPSLTHPLGTDLLGRDVLSRLLYGGRISLTLAGLATLITVCIGGALGLSAGYFGGRWDAVVFVVMNTLLAFPSLLVALVILTLFESGMVIGAFAVGFAQIGLYLQVARMTALSIKHREYVTGARALGAGHLHLLRYHILPNALPILASFATVIFSYSLLNSAALSFLGILGSPSIPDWGGMLAEGRNLLRQAPWVSIAPGMAITLTVLLVNAIGDAISQRE